MFKELLLAIILGAILGFGLTGGIVTLKKTNKPDSTVINQNQPSPTPQITINPQLSPTTVPPITPSPNEEDAVLTIDSPENESIVQSSKITIKGQTAANSNIILVTPLKIISTVANDTGYFEADIELETGVNLVQINTTTPDNHQTEKELIITYSTAKI